MVELATILVLLGPPIAILVIAYAYVFVFRKKKGKKIKKWKVFAYNVPLSFLSSGWIDTILANPTSFGISPADIGFLTQVSQRLNFLEKLPIRELVPAEVLLIISIAIIIYIILIPSA